MIRRQIIYKCSAFELADLQEKLKEAGFSLDTIQGHPDDHAKYEIYSDKVRQGQISRDDYFIEVSIEEESSTLDEFLRKMK